MSKQIVTLPLAQIYGIGLYINKSAKTLAQIAAQARGAHPGMRVYILNGGLYEGTKAVCHLKADGVVYASDQYTYWGYVWDRGPDIAMQAVPAADKLNYICCSAMLRGGKFERMIYTRQQGGKRGRTAIGIVGDKLGLYVTGDGTADAKTPETLQEELAGLGWTSAIMLDSGGSSQCDLDGAKITSGRKVHNLIIVYVREEASPVDEITQAIMTKNPCYTNGRTITPKGLMVHSTGTPGATAEELRRSMDKATAQASVDAVIDDTVTLQTLPWEARAWHCGSSANNTHISFEICEPSETRLLPINWHPVYRGATGMDPWAIKRWQSELKRVGLYAGEIDGSFGPGTEAATKAMQARLGLAADGSCGRATLEAAAAQDGSLMAYPAKEVHPYFDAVYARAVALSAYLCKEYGFNPLEDIVCHSEGYALGIASNHADVMHWFPKHGKSMDEFRRAVKAALESGEDKPPQPVEKWGDASIRKAMDNGIIQGDERGDVNADQPVTLRQVLVMADRMRLLD